MVEAAVEHVLNVLAGGGELQEAEYGALSDLSRAEAKLVRERWSALPLEARALVLERAAELADTRLELNFEVLGQIGLEDPENEVRERAVTAVWEATDERTAERLANLVVSDPNSGVRAAAAMGLQNWTEEHALGHVRPELGDRIVAALRIGIDDGAVDVRAASLEALGSITEDWVSERIAEAYESDERQLRVAAIRAMGASALERWEDYISDQLFSADPEMRFEAVVASGSLGSEDLVPHLGEILIDEDHELILAAIEALGEIGGEAALELLTEYQQDAPEGFEDAVEGAIALASDGVGLFRRFGDRAAEERQDDDEVDEE